MNWAVVGRASPCLTGLQVATISNPPDSGFSYGQVQLCCADTRAEQLQDPNRSTMHLLVETRAAIVKGDHVKSEIGRMTCCSLDHEGCCYPGQSDRPYSVLTQDAFKVGSGERAHAALYDDKFAVSRSHLIGESSSPAAFHQGVCFGHAAEKFLLFGKLRITRAIRYPDMDDEGARRS